MKKSTRSVVRRLVILLALLMMMTSSSNAFQFPFAKNNNNNPNEWTVRTCQNKDCCKQWTMSYQGLPEVLQDLLPPETAQQVHVETTACLGQCGKGPNMEMKSSNHPKLGGGGVVTVNGMTGSLSLALELEDRLDIEIPSKLIAAVTVLEKAAKAPLAEKDKFYSSVIRVLGSDPVLMQSSAHARALILRAQSRYEEHQEQEGRQQQDSNHDLLDKALSDALVATQISGATMTVQSVAWRTVSDIYRSQGQLAEAIDALREWERVDPSYRTKIHKEIAELLQSL